MRMNTDITTEIQIQARIMFSQRTIVLLALVAYSASAASSSVLRGAQSTTGTATKYMTFIQQSAKAQAQAGEMCDLVSMYIILSSLSYHDEL